MGRRIAKADVIPVRQQNQYNCVTTSLCMALRALGVPEDECSPARVNKVVGAMPLQGAAWEPMLAAANHYGMRATLTLPSTVRQLKSWTDAGKPVVIAWNPEGREWSHASLVFDVDDDLNVHVADPNIPDPDETVRVVPKSEFYSKWYEKAPQGFLIRRPACVIEREITPDGRQVMASRKKTAGVVRDSIMETDTYEVAETGRGQPLSLTPITYSFDDWEYIGEDGGVSVSWGQKSALMDRREFAAFAADMKKALAWAKRYDYSKGRNDYSRSTGIKRTTDEEVAYGGNPWSSRGASARMASRVASRYQKQSGSKRLDQGVRREINSLLIRAGLDGNGRFRSAQQGYARAVDVLQDEGIELDEVVSSHLFNLPSGTIRADIAFTDYMDRFSPISIDNSVLYLQYTELRDGVYEVVAYLS